jgi:hypothetical protein
MVNSNPYGAMSQTSTPQPGQAPPQPLASLPPNILALLQQTAQALQQQTQQPSQYGLPPPSMMNSGSPISNMPPMNTNAQPGYQQLMAYLVSYNYIPICLLALTAPFTSNRRQGSGRSKLFSNSVQNCFFPGF